MTLGPLFREGVEVSITEGHGFAAYFYLLILLVPVAFLALFLPGLDAQLWIAPGAFFTTAVAAAMILIAYFTLRIANQEFAPWRFVPLRRRLMEERVAVDEVARGHLALLGLQTAIFVLLAAPLLVWAGAIARVPAGRIAAVLALLFFYGVVYGVWGLVALAAWERKLEVRQVFIRGFFIGTMIVTAVFYLPLNPVAFLLAYLGDKPMAPLALAGRRWLPEAVHFIFHLVLFAAAVWLYRRALKREIDS